MISWICCFCEDPVAIFWRRWVGWETVDIPISFTLFIFLRAFHPSHQIQGKKVRSTSHHSNSNSFTTDKILPKLQIMLVCSNSNPRGARRESQAGITFVVLSISSVTSAVLSYTFIIAIPNKANISFYGFYKEWNFSDCWWSNREYLLLSLNSTAYFLNKGSKGN